MSMTLKPGTQRCCAKNARGEQCSRYCAAGETVCAKHQPNAPAAGVIKAQETSDRREVLNRLMKSRDERVRLRAAEILHEWEKEQQVGCQACMQREASAIASERIVAHATVEQRQTLRSLLEQVGAIKAQIRAYIAAGGTPFAEDTATPAGITVQAATEPTAPSASAPATPAPTVSVWRDGQLVEEPRDQRKWRTA